MALKRINKELTDLGRYVNFDIALQLHRLWASGGAVRRNAGSSVHPSAFPAHDLELEERLKNIFTDCDFLIVIHRPPALLDLLEMIWYVLDLLRFSSSGALAWQNPSASRSESIEACILTSVTIVPLAGYYHGSSKFSLIVLRLV
jgi:hypothetical protein